jgi:energy-coupling factor transporter ATP-binding protein EcfA2
VIEGDLYKLLEAIVSAWDDYPEDYRKNEVEIITKAIIAGECVAVFGLSGSGKSNLFGFISHCATAIPIIGVDCNRITEANSQAFFRLLRKSISSLENEQSDENELTRLEIVLRTYFTRNERLALLMDRFDSLTDLRDFNSLAGNLRSLRDANKYRLCYVIAMRHPLEPSNELAELFFGHTIWLGPLTENDARWSVNRDLKRLMPDGWDESFVNLAIKNTSGYPSLLRAACEAIAAGVEPSLENLRQFPSLVQRVKEFWSDNPNPRDLELSGLSDLALLEVEANKKIGVDQSEGMIVDATKLTAKEYLLLEYLVNHSGEVCEKDGLIRAVWPEDVIFEQGVRDESLAQLIRRLRIKIEPDPGQPVHLQTIPGRGYLLRRS